MDIKQLRALLAGAETGSVTRAAALLHIVQPAVSRQLRLLEEDIGTPLFSRGRYGMDLTEAGEIFVEHPRRALAELDRAKSEMQPSRGVSGTVTVGLLPRTCDLLVSELVTSVAYQFPAVRIRVSMGYTGHLQNWLEIGEVDAALLYDPKPSPILQVTPLVEEKLWVVARPDAGYSSGSPVHLTQVAHLPMILPNAPHGIRTLVQEACISAGIGLNVAAETNAMSVQKSLVLGGVGITILPGIAIPDDVARGALRAAPLVDAGLQRKIVLALPQNRRIPVAVRCVVDVLVAQISDAVRRGIWTTAQLLTDEARLSARPAYAPQENAQKKEDEPQ
ncbi:LysR family transcriptional regulator [Burkholderia cenocepacia]|uniref:LysR family transcriptional regulator n=1 Tax=Burkholderia cenocepacia TaxID=95486 RepID=UPI00190649A2|nr:LysR family transcriptional regulator [Burkholderia cenocepacia]MBJ9924408.1 LysR family transcriptional regulator [Burkholderia cenocepacia]